MSRMAQIDRFLAVLVSRRGDSIRLVQDEPACLLTGADSHPLTRGPLTPAQMLTIVREVAPSAAKFGKQIRFAERRGIPYVWFPGSDGAADTIKDIRSGEQVEADAATWLPPTADLAPVIGAN